MPEDRSSDIPDADEDKVVRLHPPPTEKISLSGIYSDVSFPRHGVPTANGGLRPYVAINMVSSLDGRVAVDGKVSGLGGPSDRAVMRSLRAHFDAVLIGAGTLRAEKISLNADPPELPQPLPVILTKSGDVPIDNLLAPAHEPLVLMPETAPPEREACEVLFAEYSVRALLLEGGPTLNHAFLREGLADELFVTLSPKLLGGPLESPTILAGTPLDDPPCPELLSVHLASDRLFLRYALREGRSAKVQRQGS